MDYNKLHVNFVDYCLSTTPKMRLLKRNPSDKRLLGGVNIYTEFHHIIPKHLDGKDEDNLVELLPEEHLFVHQLRYKAYKNRNDMLAVRFCLNGYSNKPYRGYAISKKILSGYAWIRQHVQSFRKDIGWHTEGGKKRISEARKGTMPVKDAESGKLVGTVLLNHPNVLSGKWVHHSKGVKFSKERKKQISELNKGSNNPNALKITDDEIIELYLECFKQYNFIIPYSYFVEWVYNEKEIKIPKSIRSRFGGGGFKRVFSIMEERTNTKYNRLDWSRNVKN